MHSHPHILIIQTAFIGDVILATSIIEQLANHYPEAKIDFLLRKGNESLLKNHPKLGQILIWDKRTHKTRNLLKMIRVVRQNRYDVVVNVQRFFSSGLLTALSGTRKKIGFKKNPLSIFFNERHPHVIGEPAVHEVHRNLSLVASITNHTFVKPKLYPSTTDFDAVQMSEKYICIAPTSVWPTKQWPAKKWVHLIQQVPDDITICLLGAPSDKDACEAIKLEAQRKSIENMAGRLSLLQSAAIMKGAVMNYVNDSAPLHLATAMNAPVTAIFCSTIPDFGFYPLSDVSFVWETSEQLDCRPCNLHGKKSCPEGHFQCAEVKMDLLF